MAARWTQVWMKVFLAKSWQDSRSIVLIYAHWCRTLRSMVHLLREFVLCSSLVCLHGIMPNLAPNLMPNLIPSFLTANRQLTPEAIVVLGGEPLREQFAAQFAKQHPDLPIFVSSGSPQEYAEYVFDQAGIDRGRVTLDYQATDTVTNFTVMAEILTSRQIKSVYILTSDFHMHRAHVVGSIVLGSRGITIHPIPIPSSHPEESGLKTVRDGLRSLVWLGTGSTFSR